MQELSGLAKCALDIGNGGVGDVNGIVEHLLHVEIAGVAGRDVLLDVLLPLGGALALLLEHLSDLDEGLDARFGAGRAVDAREDLRGALGGLGPDGAGDLADGGQRGDEGVARPVDDGQVAHALADGVGFALGVVEVGRRLGVHEAADALGLAARVGFRHQRLLVAALGRAQVLPVRVRRHVALVRAAQAPFLQHLVLLVEVLLGHVGAGFEAAAALFHVDGSP